MTRQMDRAAEMMKYSTFEDRKEFGKRGYNFGSLTAAQLEDAYDCWNHGWSIVEAYENVSNAKQKITITTADEDYNEWFNGLSAEEQQQEILAYTE